MMASVLMNAGTIFVGAVVLVTVVAIVKKLIRDKRNGKLPGCDCGCGSCPKASDCNTR